MSAQQKPFRLNQLLHALLQVISEEEAASEGNDVQQAVDSIQPTVALAELPASGGGSGEGGHAPARSATVTVPSRSMSRRAGAAKSSFHQHGGGSARHTLVPIAAEFPLRILLAEDNLINQVRHRADTKEWLPRLHVTSHLVMTMLNAAFLSLAALCMSCSPENDGDASAQVGLRDPGGR